MVKWKTGRCFVDSKIIREWFLSQPILAFRYQDLQMGKKEGKSCKLKTVRKDNKKARKNTKVLATTSVTSAATIFYLSAWRKVQEDREGSCWSSLHLSFSLSLSCMPSSYWDKLDASLLCQSQLPSYHSSASVPLPLCSCLQQATAPEDLKCVSQCIVFHHCSYLIGVHSHE